MTRALLIVIMCLAGCTAKNHDPLQPEPDARAADVAVDAIIVGEPSVVAAEPTAALRCLPGDDDGIGGTGCPVD